MMNIIHGSAHADNNVLQEVHDRAVGGDSLGKPCIGAEVFTLKAVLKKRATPPALATKEACPNLRNEEAIETILEAVTQAGYKAGDCLALDPAASEFFDGKSYVFKSDNGNSQTQMVAFWKSWADQYPIISIETAGGKRLGRMEALRELGSRGNWSATISSSPAQSSCARYRPRVAIRLRSSNQIGTLAETLDYRAG
jgi:enolase